MEQACRVLEVSRSGYYGWKAEKICRRRLQNQALRRRLIELHEKYPAMGLDSLYRLLKPEFGCSRKRVHRQMRLAGISSVRRRAYKKTTHSNHSHPIAPNLLQRNFSFDRPDQAWVGDITYIPTGEGWLYLAIVKDLCTRKIVGYAFSDKIDTRLTLAALDMAYRRRKPARGLIFHSDRGVQYAARAYRERLEAYGIRQSMSRRGDPYDNAAPIPELTDREKSRKLESKGAHAMEQKKMKKRTAPPRYDDAFKAGAVRLVTEQGRQPVEVAKELGICIDTLRSWLKASGIQMGQVSRQNREQKRIRELEAENRSLRRQLGEKDEVIDVLKKSVGILSKP